MVDNKQRQKQMQIITIIALCIAVIGLSIAYAAMSETLKVSGTANFTAADWDVHFDNVSAVTTGNATYSLPTVTATSLTNYNVVLTKPGDSVIYDFTIVNGGSIPADLTNFLMADPTCTSTTNPSDGGIVCNNLVYSLTYQDGTNIKVGDVLPVGVSTDARLTIGYHSSANILPSSNVSVSNLDVTFIYTQS